MMKECIAVLGEGDGEDEFEGELQWSYIKSSLCQPLFSLLLSFIKSMEMRGDTRRSQCSRERLYPTEELLC